MGGAGAGEEGQLADSTSRMRAWRAVLAPCVRANYFSEEVGSWKQVESLKCLRGKYVLEATPAVSVLADCRSSPGDSSESKRPMTDGITGSEGIARDGL